MAKSAWICEKCLRPYDEQAAAERCEAGHLTIHGLHIVDVEYDKAFSSQEWPSTIIVVSEESHDPPVRYRYWGRMP